MSDYDEATVRDGITAPPSHLASGFAITRHDEAHAALSRILAERATLQAEVERLREALGQAQMLYHHAARHPADVSTACDWRECRKLLTAAQPTEGRERCPDCGCAEGEGEPCPDIDCPNPRHTEGQVRLPNPLVSAACVCSRLGTVQGTPEKPRPVHKHAQPTEGQEWESSG